MSAGGETTERLLALHRQIVESDPSWMAPLRRDGGETFAAAGLPHTKLEEWRYTNLAGLAKLDLEFPERPASTDVTSVGPTVSGPSPVVFVNGLHASGQETGERFVSNFASLENAPPEFGTLVDAKAHPLAALNAALLRDGAVVRISRDAQVEAPIHILFASTGGVRCPRLLVVAEPGSRVQVIQEHLSIGSDDGFTDAVTEVQVGVNARVDLVNVQRESDAAFHISNTAARVERGGHLETHVVTLGGRLVRNDLVIALAGEGGEANLNGLFLGNGKRLVDNHSLVDHAVAHCSSRQLYKGALGDASRGVFRGRVVVRPDAQQTNAVQSNPNLLLSNDAEIDTKPQLEIHADDVKCSHGSTVGQLDEDALFYLCSRGIGADRARDLLTRGFVQEILDAIPVEGLRHGLGEVVQRSLRRIGESGA